MSTYDPNRDDDMTRDWPTDRPLPPPVDDDGGATTVVPRHNAPQPPPPSPTPPPAAPPQSPYGASGAPAWTPPPSIPPAPPAPGGGWQPPQPPQPPYGQFPGTGYPAAPVPPPPGKKRPWGLIAAALLAVVVLGVGAVMMLGGSFGSDKDSENNADSKTDTSESKAPQATDGGSSKPSPSEAPEGGTSGDVEPSALPSLLASVTDLNDRFKADLVPAGAVQNSPFTGMTIQPSNCAGALQPGIDYVYDRANYTGFAGQILTSNAPNVKVMQAVISFNTETEATRFFNDQYTAWKGCNYTEVTASGGGQSETAKTGVAAEGDGTATFLIWPDTGDSQRGCQRGMTPRKNVVVDVRVCSQNVASSGFTLARDIGAKITGER